MEFYKNRIITMDKWLDKYQFPAQENTVKNGGRIAEDGKKVNQIGEVIVYSKRKYVDELKKQQEKYLADMAKYKQDSAQWVKANDAYQDSLSLYNETKLLADENIKYGGNAYISKEDAEKDKNRMWFSASDAPGYNKKSETYQQFKNNKTDNIQPIGYVGSDSRGRKVDGDYFFINTPVYKEPEYIPMFPNKPNSPTKVTYDPKYENLQMRSLWANKAKQDTSANIGVLNRLDYNDESKGFTINEAINFPQEIKDKYNIDYIGKQIGIKKNGGEVNKFKESTKIVRNVLPTTNIYGSQHKNTRETLDYLAGKRNFKANVPTLDNFNYNKYEGIWKSWLENGTPIINNLSEWGHWGMQAGRAYYHPEENSLNINKNNFGEYFAELAHAKQKKEGTLKNDYIKYPNREDYDRYAYEDPFSGEWDAHKVLEPSLMRKYYKEPILSDEEIKKLAKDPNNVYEERQQQGWLTSGDLDRISKQRTKNWNKKNKPLINLNFENGGIIPKAKDGDMLPKKVRERLYKAIQPGDYPQDKDELKILIKNVTKGHNRFDTDAWLKEYNKLSDKLQKADKDNNRELVGSTLEEMELLKKEPTVDDIYSEAGWKKYLNLDVEQDSVFSKSKYIPKNSKNKSDTYYSLPKEFNTDLLNTLAPVSNFPKDKRAHEFMFPNSFSEHQSRARVLGNFKVDKGEDERGQYISYYDKYDLNPKLPIIGNKNIDFIGKPFEIYGRQYYEAYSPNLDYPKATEPRHAGNYIVNEKKQLPDFKTKLYNNGGNIPKAEDGKKTKKTIKVFAETPNLPEHHMYHIDDENLPINLRQISDELLELNKNRFPDYTLKRYLENYIDGYYLSRNRPSTRYQNGPYNTGFRAGTGEAPYYDDPNYTRDGVMHFLNKGIINDDFTDLTELIKDFEPGLNIESKLKDFKLLREKSKNTENRIDELRTKFYGPDINPLVKGKLDNTFITEANNLKKVFKDNPNIKIDILPIYGEQDTTKVKENIKGLTSNDDLIIMGHNGPQFAGIKNEWWNNAIKDSPACKYLGACGAEETVNKGFKDNNITYRPNASWLGVNPKSDNLIDAMYSRVPSDKGDTVKTPIEGVDYKVRKVTKKENGGIIKNSPQLINFTTKKQLNWLDKY